MVFSFFFSANYNICVLQLHLLLCRKIPLSCPYSCGISIPRGMVHVFHHSLSDVIDGRVVVYIAGMAAVWVPASKALIAMFCLFSKVESDLPNK